MIDSKVYRPDSLEWDSFLVSLLLHAMLFLILWLYVPTIITSEHNGNSQIMRIPIKTLIIDETPNDGPLIDVDPALPPMAQPIVQSPQKQTTPATPPPPQSTVRTQASSEAVVETPPAQSRPASGPVDGTVGPAQTYLGDRESPILGYPVNPVYPKSALNFGWSGTVAVDFLIDADGKVKDYTIVQSTGHPELDMAFVRYMQNQKLQPKRIQGQNVESTIRMSHEFAIN